MKDLKIVTVAYSFILCSDIPETVNECFEGIDNENFSYLRTTHFLSLRTLET